MPQQQPNVSLSYSVFTLSFYVSLWICSVLCLKPISMGAVLISWEVLQFFVFLFLIGSVVFYMMLSSFFFSFADSIEKLRLWCFFQILLYPVVTKTMMIWRCLFFFFFFLFLFFSWDIKFFFFFLMFFYMLFIVKNINFHSIWFQNYL